MTLCACLLLLNAPIQSQTFDVSRVVAAAWESPAPRLGKRVGPPPAPPRPSPAAEWAELARAVADVSPDLVGMIWYDATTRTATAHQTPAVLARLAARFAAPERLVTTQCLLVLVPDEAAGGLPTGVSDLGADGLNALVRDLKSRDKVEVVSRPQFTAADGRRGGGVIDGRTLYAAGEDGQPDAYEFGFGFEVRATPTAADRRRLDLEVEFQHVTYEPGSLPPPTRKAVIAPRPGDIYPQEVEVFAAPPAVTRREVRRRLVVPSGHTASLRVGAFRENGMAWQMILFVTPTATD
jgi:hypothetical protein